MNDLETLHDAWEAPPAPSQEAYAEARAALLERARPRPRRRRAPLRITAVVTAGAIAAAFLVVVQNLGDNPRAVPPAAAEVFERAAHAAETKPFTAPRPDQWVYTEDRITTSDADAPTTRRMWHRVDGGAIAFLDERGEIAVEEFSDAERPPRGGPFDSNEQVAKLPRDPDALLSWAYEQAKHVEGAGLTEHGDVYAILSGLLAANVLPPDLEAGIFRAMKRVPGVTVSTVDVLGRRVLSLAQTEDWLREELFLDPATYTYAGKRGTVVRDGEVEAGHTATSIRVAAEIQDEPAER